MTKKKQLEIENELARFKQIQHDTRIMNLDFDIAIQDLIKVLSSEKCVYSEEDQEPTPEPEPITEDLQKEVIVDSIETKKD